MPISRFPNAKYIRSLVALHKDLCYWRLSYMAAAEETERVHLAGRFAARAAVLEEAIEHTRQLVDTLYTLPRLS